MPRAWGVGETEAAAGSPMPCQRRTSKRRIQASCDGGPGRGVRGTTRSAGRRWRDNARHAEAVEPAHGQFGTAWRWRQRRAQRCGEGRNHRARTRPGRTHGGEHGIGGGRGRWAHNLDRGGRGRHHTPPTGACRGQSTVAGASTAELVSTPGQDAQPDRGGQGAEGGRRRFWRQARACGRQARACDAPHWTGVDGESQARRACNGTGARGRTHLVATGHKAEKPAPKAQSVSGPVGRTGRHDGGAVVQWNGVGGCPPPTSRAHTEHENHRQTSHGPRKRPAEIPGTTRHTRGVTAR